MDSAHGNPSPMRETHEIFHKVFTEIQDIFDKYFKALFGVISFKSTTMGEALFIAYPNVMMGIDFMIVLYFSLWLLGTMLPHHSTIFQPMLVLIMILIATVYSVLVMTIVSSLSLLDCVSITFIPWVAVFAFTAYYFYQEIYNCVERAILDTIKQLIHESRTRSTRVPV